MLRDLACLGFSESSEMLATCTWLHFKAF